MMGRIKLCWTGLSFMSLISWLIVETMIFSLNVLLDAFLRWVRSSMFKIQAGALSILDNIFENYIVWIIILTLSYEYLLLFVFLQILNPNPDAMSKMITENASEEFLYSLSNYCALQVWNRSLVICFKLSRFIIRSQIYIYIFIWCPSSCESFKN